MARIEVNGDTITGTVEELKLYCEQVFPLDPQLAEEHGDVETMLNRLLIDGKATTVYPTWLGEVLAHLGKESKHASREWLRERWLAGESPVEFAGRVIAKRQREMNYGK